jgi:fibronectin-binding autotransporter adhesin
MADRYFDCNGTTAGFGTLTDTWSNSLARWSTSNLGTATPGTFTFTNADAAFFGSSAVASTIAGTATIATGTTVTLNGIYARNLTAQQTIAAAGTGALVFAGTLPFLYAGNAFAHSLNITAPISGTAGIVAQALNQYAYAQLNSDTSGLSGACDVQSGQLFVSRGFAAYSPSSLAVGANARFAYFAITTDFTFPVVPTGDASAIVQCNGNMTGTNGVTYPAGIGAFAGYIGTRVQTEVGFQLSKFRFSELPSGIFIACRASSTNATPQALATYTGAGETKATRIVIESDNNTSVPTLTAGTYALYANGTGPMVLTGTVQRTNDGIGGSPGNSGRMNLTLGGTNVGDNTLSGDISEPAVLQLAILGIAKVDAGRWVLSGTNSHTGVHTISAGTLAANSATALGSATSTGGVSITGTGVLELGDGVTLNKSVTDFSLGNATNPVQTAGTSTLQSKQVTLSVTPTFTVTSGRKLTIAPQGAGIIVGSGTGITKAGDGELELTAKANTFNGAVTVSAGTLTVGSVANGGSAAAWGQASSAVAVSGTLKYNGAAGSSSRAVQMTGSAPTLDASGSGALTLSNVTQDTTAKTMTLRGTSTDANTISNAIANNTGAVSLAKEDAGRWVLSGALSYTGTTAVNGGTLRVETTNSNTTSGAVTIGASGTVELVTATLASSGASAGEVLGTGDVTVNGVIKTRGGTTQKGQVRYGGNLTFGAGSSLYIGAAA